jgi:hypothetical protein
MWFAIEQVGRLVALVAAAAAVSVVVALAVAAWVARGHWAPLKRFSSFVLDALYLPLKLALARFGGVSALDRMMVALKNRANHARFARSRRRMLLAPTCLRHLECPAPSTRHGILCTRCGKCKVHRMLAEAERLGYRSFLLTGSSFVPQLVAQERPDGALLVACPYECNKVMMALGGLATYAVTLERDGCVNTDVSLEKVAEALELGLDDEAVAQAPAGERDAEQH